MSNLDPCLFSKNIFKSITIEPMINLGGRQVRTLADGWTVVTRDHKLSAQWEHTILVTQNGYEILTQRQEEKNMI